MLGLGLLLLAGCVTPPGPGDVPRSGATSTTETHIASSPAGSVSSAPPAAFNDVVARAGEQLLHDAEAAIGGAPRELVIDPLIDASTGQQTTGTVQMGQRLGALIRSRMPQWNVRTLTRTTLSSRPLLLIGTLTAISTAKAGRDDNADAFRVCLALIDLRSGRLVAKRVDRATVATVSAEPTPFFRDSPTWALDQTALAYIKSCQGSAPGDSVDPGYLLRLPASAVINEAQVAFADNKPAEAYRLLREVQPIADPDDLRILNGLYLASWRTGRKKEATETFARIVAVGLDNKKLPIKLFFNPGSTTLLASPDLQTQYAIWLREVALQVGVRETCMKVVGHTSRTGDAATNLALSQRRAAIVRQTLERLNKSLETRLVSEGKGASEVLVGLGTDDMRDALDRRVEFRTIDCT